MPKATECDYQFSDAPVPEGFDPDAHGYRDCPAGEWLMHIDGDGSNIEQAQEFTSSAGKGQQKETFRLDQWRPRLIVAGRGLDAAGRPIPCEHNGASIIDFLPIPTPGAEWSGWLANRWANHMNGFGFKPPPNSAVPPGFKFKHLYGTPQAGPFAMVQIVQSVDRDGNPRLYKGAPQMQVKLFGYRNPKEGGTPAKSATNEAEAAGVSKPAAVAPTKEWDL